MTSEFVAGIQLRHVALHWVFWDFMKPQLEEGDPFHCVIQTADRCGPLGWTELWQPERAGLTARHLQPFSGRAHRQPGLARHCVQSLDKGENTESFKC